MKGVTPDIVLPDNAHYTTIGEKRLDHPMEWTEIEKVEFQKDDSFSGTVNKLTKQSSTRVQVNEIFKKIDENAQRLKRNREASEYSLNLDQNRLLVNEREEESKKYRKMFKTIEGISVENLAVDLPYIQLDSVRIGQNESFMKNIKKDVYIDETLNIMRDLVSSNKRIVKGS